MRLFGSILLLSLIAACCAGRGPLYGASTEQFIELELKPERKIEFLLRDLVTVQGKITSLEIAERLGSNRFLLDFDEDAIEPELLLKAVLSYPNTEAAKLINAER